MTASRIHTGFNAPGRYKPHSFSFVVSLASEMPFASFPTEITVFLHRHSSIVSIGRSQFRISSAKGMSGTSKCTEETRKELVGMDKECCGIGGHNDLHIG
jgi:hypothetical protein